MSANVPQDNSLVGWIFARGGSKSVPRKNIRPAGHLPLIAHSIICGLNSRYIGRMLVSTDDNEIARVAQEHGAEVPFSRPAALSGDTSSELDAWRHAIRNTPELLDQPEKATFVSLPATSPLRNTTDVDRAIERYLEGDIDLVFGITPSTRSPWLNMVTLDNHGLLNVVNSGSTAIRRQDTPPVFDVTTCVYVGNVQYILNCERLMEGRVGAVEIPPERALDIDTEFDLHLADLLLKHPMKAPKS